MKCKECKNWRKFKSVKGKYNIGWCMAIDGIYRKSKNGKVDTIKAHSYRDIDECIRPGKFAKR